MMKIEKIKSILIFLLFSIVPLASCDYLIDQYLNLRLLIISIIILGVSSVNFFKNRKIIVSKNTIIVFLTFTLLFGISSFASINLGETIFHFLKIVMYFLLFVTLSNENKNRNHILIAIVFTHLIIVLFGYLQYINTNDLYSVTSTFAHRNLFSIYLLISMPFLLETLKQKSVLLKIGATIGTISSLFLILLLQTRSVWLALLMIVLVFFIMMVKDTKLIYRIAFLFIFMIVSIIFFYKNDSNNMIYSTINFNNIENQFSYTVKNRLQVWENTIEMIIEYPLGVGAGNWRIVYPKYGLSDYESQGRVFIQRPHNDYLWIIAQYGTLSIVLIVYLICLVVKNIIKSDIRNTFVFGAGIIGYLVVSFFSFPLERPSLMIFFITLVVFLNKKNPQKKILSISYVYSIVLIALFSIIILIRIYGEYYGKKSLVSQQNRNSAQIAYFSNKANNFFYTLDPFSTPNLFYSAMYSYRKDLLDSTINVLINALKNNPNHIHSLNNLGSLYMLKKDYKNAEYYFKKAIKISPHLNETVLNLSNLYIETNRNADALVILFQVNDNSISSQFDELLLKATQTNSNKNLRDIYFRSNSDINYFLNEIE